jgi:hypothetical protein
VVEQVDGPVGGCVLGGGIDDLAAAQHVIEEDESARAHMREEQLVVGVVTFLVGIDENEIERNVGRK